jgi:hypothetical protein
MSSTPKNPQNGTPTKQTNGNTPVIEVKTPIIDRSPSSSNLLRTPSMETPNPPKIARQESFTERIFKSGLSLATGKELNTPKKDKVTILSDEVSDYKAKTELLIGEFKLMKADATNKIAILEQNKKENLAQIDSLNATIIETIKDREAKLALLKSQQLEVVTKMENRYDDLHGNYVTLRKTTADEIDKLTWEKKAALDQAENSEKLRLKNIQDELAERTRIQGIYDAERDDLLGKINVLTTEKENVLAEGRNLLSRLTNLNEDYVELPKCDE